jgi:hypothetical protein
MSTIKVNRIENTSTTDGGVSIDVDGHVTIDGQQLPTAGPLSNRNLIINGAMTVAQRGTQSTSITLSNYYVVDRYYFGIGSLGTWTIDQSTDAPDDFSKSLKYTCTTADATPAAGDIALILYNIEAQNLQHLGFGTSNAKPLVLSFWVKSNKTGDASISLMQPDASNRLFSTSYNISAADTWEYKTIQIPADTGGTIDDDNDKGLRIDWYLNSGSTFSNGSYQTWGVVNNANRNVSNLGVGGAVNDYFQITGVQLEVGSKPTPFEHELYSQTLAKCQRYYQIITPLNRPSSTVALGAYYTATRVFCVVDLKQTMRGEPTLVTDGDSGSFQIFRADTNDICNAPTFGASQNINQVEFEFTSGVNTAGSNFPCWIRTSDTTGTNTGDTAFIAAQAEL